MVNWRAWVYLMWRIFLDSWPFWAIKVALESWEVWQSNGVTNGAQTSGTRSKRANSKPDHAVPGTWIASGDNTRYYNFVVPRMAHDPALILERPIPNQKITSPNRL